MAVKQRVIKFRYVWQHEETGTISMPIFTLDQIANGLAGVDRYVLIAQNQFTGLLDRSGKEIYEGDILASYSYHRNGKTFWHNKEVVEFKLEPASDGEYGGSYYGYLFNFDSIESYEVIGNIYENSDLLKNDK